MKGLGRQSLSVILANRLHEDIVAGVWKRFLPGYRVLAAHYEISTRTTKEALARLEKQGVISAGAQGKRREIFSKSVAANDPSHMNLLYIIDSRETRQSSDDIQLMTQITNYWEKRYGSAMRVSGDLTRNTKPKNLLEKWISMYSVTHLIIFIPPAAWVMEICKLGIPCYYLGGEFPENLVNRSKLAGAAFSLEQAMTFILQRLKSLGHTQILIPVAQGSGSHRRILQQVMRDVYQDQSTADECEMAVAQFPDLEPDAWLAGWKKSFHGRPITAVVVTSGYELLSFYTFCGQQGIEIGKDVSVICLNDEGIFDWLDPVPTRTTSDPVEIYDDFKAWVRNRFQGRKFYLIQLKWVEGDTLSHVDNMRK